MKCEKSWCVAEAVHPYVLCAVHLQYPDYQPGKRMAKAPASKPGGRPQTEGSGPRHTSLAAWHSIKGHLPAMQSRIYKALCEVGPMTCEEWEHHLAMKHQSASAVIGAMERAGLIEDTGETRPTVSNRQATVWRARHDTRGT